MKREKQAISPELRLEMAEQVASGKMNCAEAARAYGSHQTSHFRVLPQKFSPRHSDAFPPTCYIRLSASLGCNQTLAPYCSHVGILRLYRLSSTLPFSLLQRLVIYLHFSSSLSFDFNTL